jgi:hypothetical protein
MKNGSLVQRESGDPMSLTFFRNKPIECAGKRQFAEGMLDRQFPNRHDTEEDFVGRIREDLARRWRQVFRARDDPQERAGIKKALHPWEPSNVRSSSSGRGSKNERGTVNRPLAKPIGRGRAGTWGNGVISATG